MPVICGGHNNGINAVVVNQFAKIGKAFAFGKLLQGLAQTVFVGIAKPHHVYAIDCAEGPHVLARSTAAGNKPNADFVDRHSSPGNRRKRNRSTGGCG